MGLPSGKVQLQQFRIVISIEVEVRLFSEDLILVALVAFHREVRLARSKPLERRGITLAEDQSVTDLSAGRDLDADGQRLTSGLSGFCALGQCTGNSVS